MAEFVDDQAQSGATKRKRVLRDSTDPKTLSFYFMGTWQDVSNPPTPEMFSKKEIDIKYMVHQLEKCPKTGKLHYQCYFEFTKKRRLGQLLKTFPQCFWIRRDGTATQAIDYCTKSETRQSPPVFYGTPSCDLSHVVLHNATLPECAQPIPVGNKRVSQLALATEYILKTRCSLKEIALKYPDVYVRHQHGLSKLLSEIAPKRNFKTKVIVYYGMPESGKSRAARENCHRIYGPDDTYVYSKIDCQSGREWWELYRSERAIIIDEMDGETFGWNRMLNLLDRHEVKVGCKNASFEFAAETIFITANTPPSHWFAGKHEFPALRRRIDECRKFVLIKGERDEDGNCVYEAQLDTKEMRDPDKSEHNKWIEHINEQAGFVGKSLAPETIFTPPPPDLTGAPVADDDTETFTTDFDDFGDCLGSVDSTVLDLE